MRRWLEKKVCFLNNFEMPEGCGTSLCGIFFQIKTHFFFLRGNDAGEKNATFLNGACMYCRYILWASFSLVFTTGVLLFVIDRTCFSLAVGKNKCKGPGVRRQKEQLHLLRSILIMSSIFFSKTSIYTDVCIHEHASHTRA